MQCNVVCCVGSWKRKRVLVEKWKNPNKACSLVNTCVAMINFLALTEIACFCKILMEKPEWRQLRNPLHHCGNFSVYQKLSQNKKLILKNERRRVRERKKMRYI